VAFFTYFAGYHTPSALFWDENYHIASAQKSLHGVLFMEPHPPLGKLLIALGEWLLHPNLATDQFLTTDYARDLPPAFSFLGYRFFPALFGWLTAPVLYLVMLTLTRRVNIAVALSALYVFDNALIVHSRGAMLESIQLFFISLFLLGFVRALAIKPVKDTLMLNVTLMGLAIGAALSTKLNAAILLLLVLALAIRLRRTPALCRDSLVRIAVCTGTVFCLVWQIHFSIGHEIQTKLPNNGFYRASPEYRASIMSRESWSPQLYAIMLSDSFEFFRNYQKGVPRLNLCKQDENGSPPTWWPLGGRAINYRWDRSGETTRYLYLVANPAVWWSVGAAIALGCALLITAPFSAPRRRFRRKFLLISLLTTYFTYMLLMISLDRVMYLYHYFIPLVLGMLVLATLLQDVRGTGRRTIGPSQRAKIATGLALVICTCFFWFRPLSYGGPLTNAEIIQRSWLPAWDLRCADCPTTNGIANWSCMGARKAK